MDAADVFRVGYCDLSLPSNVPKSERDALLRDAARLGYQVVAIDHRMTKLPAGFKAPKLPSDLHGLRVLRRLTLTSSSPTSLSTLTGSARRAFDIVAAEASNEDEFSTLCRTADVHMISVEASSRLGFRPKGALVLAAQARGIGFELLYAPAIRDSSALRYFVANLAEVARLCRGKNVVLSSGASHRLELRAPHDVASLAAMAGLSRQVARQAVLAGPVGVCRTALSSRVAEGVCVVVQRPSTKRELLQRQFGTAGAHATPHSEDTATERGVATPDAAGAGAGAFKRPRTGEKEEAEGSGAEAAKVRRIPGAAGPGQGGQASSRSGTPQKQKKKKKKKGAKRAVAVAAPVDPGMALQ